MSFTHRSSFLGSITLACFLCTRCVSAARREVRSGVKELEMDLASDQLAANVSDFVCPEECQECCQWQKLGGASKSQFKCHIKHVDEVEPSYDEEHIFLNGGPKARSRKCDKPVMKHPDLYKTKCNFESDEKVANTYKKLPKQCAVALACCQKDEDLWTEEVCVAVEDIRKQAEQELEFHRLRHQHKSTEEFEAAAKVFMKSMTIELRSAKSGKKEKYTRHPEQYYENTPGPDKYCQLPGSVHQIYQPKSSDQVLVGCCLTKVPLEERYIKRELTRPCSGDSSVTCRTKIWETRKWSECAEFEQVYRCATPAEKQQWKEEKDRLDREGVPENYTFPFTPSKVRYRRVFSEPSKCLPVNDLSKGCPRGYSSSVNCPSDCYERLSPTKLPLYHLTLDY